MKNNLIGNTSIPKNISVIGGGIAGLSAAYYAQKKAAETNIPINLTILESDSHWGGKIVTDLVDGFVIEGGPDTFIITKPWAVRLCQELGIADSLKGTNPHKKNTYILHSDRLHPLPGGLTMMIPTDFGSMLRTGLLSWSAKVRMGMDYLIPSRVTNGEESMGTYISRRLGRHAYERLVEPLMSGIYAGDGDKLSLQATFPFLRELEEKHGGLVKGALAIRKQRAARQRSSQSGNGRTPPPGSRSIFLTPTTGLAELVESLVAHLEAAGTGMRLNTSVAWIEPEEDSYQLILGNGETLSSDGIIVAAPSFVAGDLIAGFAPHLAGELKSIEYVTTATVSLAFREVDMVRPLDGYGYVIPRREGRKALACTWTSTKFPHRAPDGYTLLRVFIGRAGQESELSWDDESLLAIARQELQATLGITAQPLFHRIFLWEKAMPQYNVGHMARLDRIDTALQGLPHLALAGNGYGGIGIPDCIHSGELAAERILHTFQEGGGAD